MLATLAFKCELKNTSLSLKASKIAANGLSRSRRMLCKVTLATITFFSRTASFLMASITSAIGLLVSEPPALRIKSAELLVTAFV